MANGEIRENNYSIRGGSDGATFVPSMTEDGYLIWSNNKGYNNPPPTFVKGLKGDAGDSPYIADNGNWWVGDYDTGVSASTGLSVQYDEETESLEIGSVDITPERGKRLSIINGYTVYDKNAVPKRLSIFAKADVSTERESIRLFVDANGNDKYITLQQLKDMNTKVAYVDNLNDNQISSLSAGDVVLKNKEI